VQKEQLSVLPNVISRKSLQIQDLFTDLAQYEAKGLIIHAARLRAPLFSET